MCVLVFVHFRFIVKFSFVLAIYAVLLLCVFCVFVTSATEGEGGCFHPFLFVCGYLKNVCGCSVCLWMQDISKSCGWIWMKFCGHVWVCDKDELIRFW